MKTVKYSISFYSVETELSTEICISKKEYQKQLDFLENQLIETREYESPVEYRNEIYETEKVLSITHYFTVGMGTTSLTCCKCKAGYHFK